MPSTRLDHQQLTATWSVQDVVVADTNPRRDGGRALPFLVHQVEIMWHAGYLPNPVKIGDLAPPPGLPVVVWLTGTAVLPSGATGRRRRVACYQIPDELHKAPEWVRELVARVSDPEWRAGA